LQRLKGRRWRLASSQGSSLLSSSMDEVGSPLSMVQGRQLDSGLPGDLKGGAQLYKFLIMGQTLWDPAVESPSPQYGEDYS
jgi:hypothetical protein